MGGDRGLHTRTSRVGRLDAQAAGFPVWIVLGPLESADAERISATFAAMAAVGPLYRVGLQPTPTSTRWHLSDGPADHSLPTATIDDSGSLEDIVASLRVGTDTVPIGVRQLTQGYYLVRIDHGVGDAALMVEVLAALSYAAERVGFAEPLPEVTTNHPFPLAVKRALNDPTAAYRAFRHTLTSHVSKRTFAPRSPAMTPMQSEPGAAAPARHVFVRSAPDFIARFKEYRRRSPSKVSLAAALIASINEALRAEGVDIGDHVEVVTDLRKYLPQGQATLGNFVSVVALPCATGESPQQVAAALATEIDSVAPLVKSLGSLTLDALARLRPNRLKRPTNEAVRGDARGRRIVVSYSDVTKLPMDTRIRWSEPTRAEMAVMLPYTDAARLSLCFVSLRGQLQVTAVFSARAIDPTSVRQALERALDIDYIEGLSRS